MVDAIGQIENALQERGAGRKRNARIAGEFRRYRYVRRFETELAGGERLRIGRSEESLKDLFTGRGPGRDRAEWPDRPARRSRRRSSASCATPEG